MSLCTKSIAFNVILALFHVLCGIVDLDLSLIVEY